MMSIYKRCVSKLPLVWQQELKRRHFRRQIRRGRFETSEPEFELLGGLLCAGDWVIDVGANVGHYTKKFSDLVGHMGRVIAFEPVPETFELLAANASLFRYKNVTLLNLAASDRTALVGISIPSFETGLQNYYEASISTINPSLQVMALAIDSLTLTHPVRLVKVDAEGHDTVVLLGIRGLLLRDHPTIIVETTSDESEEMLRDIGYKGEHLPGSPNTLFRWVRLQ